jgi:hypothetical protein
MLDLHRCRVIFAEEFDDLSAYREVNLWKYEGSGELIHERCTSHWGIEQASGRKSGAMHQKQRSFAGPTGFKQRKARLPV